MLRALRIAFLIVIAVALVALMLRLQHRPGKQGNRSPPSEPIQAVEKCLDGKTCMEIVVRPVLHAIQLQHRIARPVVPPLTDLGKGQRLNNGITSLLAPYYRVATIAELAQAMKEARAGQIIEIIPGSYVLNQTLVTGRPGTVTKPIVLRAARAGTTMIDTNTEIGIKVTQPYWVFENLMMRGICSEDSYCEHAFQVVGNAHHIVIHNNWLEDFNAQIKVNGDNGIWPDDGLVSFNTLTNTRPRNTHRSVASFDLVGANRWVVADNVVSNFVKRNGNRISYGVFMKGNSREGRIERNLVICTTRDIAQAGERVGVSFGGGGTDTASCRYGGCESEHSGGLAANNIVAHCNNSGIDINYSRHNLVAFNTLINTSGIDLRGEGSSAALYGNLLEGRIRTRDGGELDSSTNEIADLSTIFASPDALQLKWRFGRKPIANPTVVLDDFCGREREESTFSGATSTAGKCQ